MANVYGTFILSMDKNKFSGEFFNNKMKSFSHEQVRLLERGDADFVGRYEANWQEDSGSVSAALEIDLESDDIYILCWEDVRLNGELQTVNFTGRGVVRNGTLFCVYEMHWPHD